MNKLVNVTMNATDKAAIALSSICMVHCIVLPILLIALPSVSSLLAFNDERFHFWLLYAVVPISVFAIAAGYLHHRQARIFFISALGMLCLIGAALYGHDVLGDIGEVGLTIFGSLLIAYGHLRNLRSRRRKLCKK